MKQALADILDNEDELERNANEAFAEVDTDGSGSVDVSELGTALQTLTDIIGVEAPSQEDIDNIYAMVDTSDDGKINASEFKEFIRFFLQQMHDNM